MRRSGPSPHRSPCLIVWHRIRADFLMPSRLGAFRRTLEVARHLGYETLGIGPFSERRDEPADGSQRLLVLRHDVDTDPRTASAMWRIESDLGMTGSWFFRLATRDLPLMRAIAGFGGEVGYHYEEVATIAKERNLRTREEALRALPAARDRFRTNLTGLRAATGLPMRVAASHGDFVNRRLGVANSMLLADHRFGPTSVSISRATTMSSWDGCRAGRRTRRHRGAGGTRTRLPHWGVASRWSTSSSIRVIGEPHRS